MGKKKTVILVILLSGTVLVSLLIFSKMYMANESGENTYQHGTLSIDKEFLVYVDHEEGLQTLNLANELTGETQRLISAKEGDQILDPTVNSASRNVTYLANSPEKTSLYSIDFDSHKIEKHMTVDAPVREFVESNEKIFYVKGNYQHSDDEGNPFHFYDIYSYDSNTEEHQQLTKKDAFYISSLVFDDQSQKLYFIMNQSKSGDPFEAEQGLYELSLKDHSLNRIATGHQDIFEVDLNSAQNEIIFSGISNPDSGSSYKYELFSVNLDTYKTKRLTFLEAFVTDPVYSESANQVYFAYNKKFPGRDYTNFDLYKLDRDTLETEKLSYQFRELGKE
ncbi:TolB family protein [Rossellomorea vietnamensis]|uniref:TolB family protein n=1 Tax=Rossellomorea vietnamensis TaxID=218284 RepID=UPI003CEF6E26